MSTTNFDRSDSKLLRQFGSRLREIRHAQNLSQEDLAYHAKLHRTYVGSVERGERNVGLINMIKLASALGVAPSDLFLKLDKSSEYSNK